MRALFPGMRPAVTPCGTVAALAAAVALSLSACTPDQAVSVNNNTDVTIRIQDLSGGRQGVAATYAAGTGGGINIFTPEGKCSDHLQWRAIDPTGNVVSTLTKACQGDTWNIEPKGK
jgi:P pilus assembly chaperone PapD